LPESNGRARAQLAEIIILVTWQVNTNQSKLSKKHIIRDMVVTAAEILVLNSLTRIEIVHMRP